ncbi:unnamed protein product [Staurois parvus]|uniref:Uncharacterized protein n=1 Tax=Staurois parvus TaxID=386267 RepID=A0ABN9CBZ0_9NEOB|nr:unnamed protein product [Staurois parvus]
MWIVITCIEIIKNIFLLLWIVCRRFRTSVSRGGLTIWKLGHCPRARDAPWYLFHRLF